MYDLNTEIDENKRWTKIWYQNGYIEHRLIGQVFKIGTNEVDVASILQLYISCKIGEYHNKLD